MTVTSAVLVVGCHTHGHIASSIIVRWVYILSDSDVHASYFCFNCVIRSTPFILDDDFTPVVNEIGFTKFWPSQVCTIAALQCSILDWCSLYNVVCINAACTVYCATCASTICAMHYCTNHIILDVICHEICMKCNHLSPGFVNRRVVSAQGQERIAQGQWNCYCNIESVTVP